MEVFVKFYIEMRAPYDPLKSNILYHKKEIKK